MSEEWEKAARAASESWANDTIGTIKELSFESRERAVMWGGIGFFQGAQWGKPKWVKVSERLPEVDRNGNALVRPLLVRAKPGRKVWEWQQKYQHEYPFGFEEALAYFCQGKDGKGVLHLGTGELMGPWFIDGWPSEVTHWRELPDKPEGE